MAVRDAPETSTSEHPETLKMSYEEFRTWAGENVLAEWDAATGEGIVFMPPKNVHQRLLVWLSALLHFFTRFFDLGELIAAPFEMKVSPTGSAREPDILFIAAAHRDRLTEERLNGPADLVIEIVSDDSVTRDRVRKFEEYEEVGVPEYWIIDNRSRRRRAEFYQLDENGQFQPVPVGKDGIYRSKVLPGFWLNVSWLWAETPPDPQLTFAEIAAFPPDVLAQLRAAKEKGAPRERD